VNARAALKRDILAALAQLQQDIPAFQYRTVAGVKAAEEKCAETIVSAAVARAPALAQGDLFELGEAS